MDKIAIRVRYAGPKGELLETEEIENHKALVKTDGEEYSLQEFEESFNSGSFDDEINFIHFFKKEESDDDFIRRIKSETINWLNSKFNKISLSLLEKYLPQDPHFYIRKPHKVWIKEYLDGIDENEIEDEIDYESVENSEDYQNWIEENDKECELEIIWGTVFESDSDFSDDFYEKAEELGLLVIEEADEDLNKIIAVNGGGFDFYEEYWTPLYLSLCFKEKDRERYNQILSSRNQ